MWQGPDRLNLDGGINRWCPSLGLPVPSTAQLSNPQQALWGSDRNGGFTLPMQEPNGVYTGDSAGTYVVCVQPNGDKMKGYDEQSDQRRKATAAGT